MCFYEGENSTLVVAVGRLLGLARFGRDGGDSVNLRLLAIAAIVFASSAHAAEIRLGVRADQSAVEQGRVVRFRVEATEDGKGVGDAIVVSYVDGQRWGTIVRTDPSGDARVGIPFLHAGKASVRFDVVSLPDQKAKLDARSPLVESPTVSKAIEIDVAPPPATSVPTTAPAWDTFADTWVGTDPLGRALPTFDEVGPPKPNKSVGIFYYIWQEHFSRDAFKNGGGILDVMDFVKQNPADPPFVGGSYWWSEPLFGYYNSGDEYVLRKHAQMLADAGIDTLIYDTSNNLGYTEQWLVHADVLRSMRELGLKTPSIAHLCWASVKGGVMATMIRDIYDAGLFRELWFQWKGKPLLLAKATDLPEGSDIPERFSLRTSWAWTNPGGWFGDGKDKWPWLAEVPASYGWHESPDKPEQIVVTAGHHASTNKGKSYSHGKQPPRSQERSGEGIQFQEQWDHALKVDPEFVFVTQWNEWIAGAFPAEKDGEKFLDRTLKKGERKFVDEYDPEFSRDTEPMKGGYGDNYYYQLVANIRRYKGVRPIAPVVAKPIAIDGKFDDWRDVTPEFRDTIGDPAKRDAYSYGWVKHYLNNTGRNDIVASKVSCEAKNVYFYVRTREAMTASTDKDWMQLLLNPFSRYDTGWIGYDYKIDFNVNGKARLLMDRGGKNDWADNVELQPITFRVCGNEMELAIPLADLTIDSLPATIDFKWADHCYETGEASDFTVNGDAAPNDRFNYRAILK